jgi:hypothetical protein
MIDLFEAGEQLRRAAAQPATPIEHLVDRNRRRRHRRRIRRGAATAAVVGLMVIGVVVAVRSPGGMTLRVQTAPRTVTPRTTQPIVNGPAATAGPTGEVTGRIIRCSGLGPIYGQSPFTGGTVVALKGTITYQPIYPAGNQDVFPTEVAARETVQPGKEFHFTLPPGSYVLRLSNGLSWVQIEIHAGEIIRQDMPNLCP